MARPNFFIVGAAKAGTTSLHHALRHHPAIFMTEPKEPGYFSPDVSGRTQWNSDLTAYLRLFDGSEQCAVRGESSPSYLLSGVAAAGIREFAPDARILIVLRDPLESIGSVFAEARKWGIEPKRTLAAAVSANRPLAAPDTRDGTAWLRYVDVVTYADQVERYVEAFPREQLHIARHDDMVTDPDRFLRAVFEFLGVENADVPLRRDNERHSYRSATVQRLLMKRFANADEPRSAQSLRERARRRALRLNFSSRPVVIPPPLRASLIADLRPDVERLVAITGLDLSGWLAPAERELSSRDAQ